jgi:tetraacyldisaccharide 4'-kinase
LKTKGIYFLYRLSQALGWPLLIGYFLWRAFKNRTYVGTIPERLGFVPRAYRQAQAGSIWLHAVSVGEVMACLELVRRLRAEFPRTPLFVSVGTLAGRATAEQKLTGCADVFYAPLDFVFAVRRVLRALRPSLVIVAETEIWPNLFREVKRTGSGLLVINGRISERAAPRYLRHRWFFAHVLCWPDRILAQNEEAARRFIGAGAPAGRVATGGNLKYDYVPVAGNAELIRALGAREVWIAASTMPPDEDDHVIAAFQKLAPHHPALLLVLAPRKPEGFDEAAQKLLRARIRFTRRTAPGTLELPGVLLLDTIGELAGLFAEADVVFVGGSLVTHGGHNILEPASFGKPIIVGPHMQNFQAIADQFRAAGALVEVRPAADLASAVERLLRNPGDLGERARRCAEANRGATRRALEEIRSLYGECLPRHRRSTAEALYLWPLAQVWKWAGARRGERMLAQRAKLETPVVSIGNITMGGTGKTPMVLWLVSHLENAAILTRGYGRQSPEKYLILEAGARSSPRNTGDEAQILLRAGVAALGIGPNRVRAGRLVERRFAPDVLILDDGFQHTRIARDLDVLLIDALNPFGGKEVFPLGRLREPLFALGRAGVFVITRTEHARNLAAIERELRRHNGRAPIFHARTRVDGWVDAATGSPAVPKLPAGAFCGLGNPRSFWRTLEASGIEPVERFEFADHHVYRPGEIRRMAAQLRAAGAESVLTTEKDVINLCDEWEGLFAPVRVYWLRIEMEVERGEKLLGIVRAAIGRRE